MNILERIVHDTRDLLARRKALVTPSALEARPFFHSPTLSLAAALRGERLRILAELKKASPSRGVLRPDFDIEDLARQYKLHGAAAVSVLTEPLYFQGSLDNLARTRQTIDLPLLRKDFIVDPYQLIEARAYGADAVLLIAGLLDRHQLHDLHQAAGELDLECLVEVYDPDELDRIDFDQVAILGVNNRNLRTFEVDLDHSLRVFERVPPGVVRVSESGLRTPEDLVRVRLNGTDAVLIGETFMTARHPGQALSELLRGVEASLRPAPRPLKLVGS